MENRAWTIWWVTDTSDTADGTTGPPQPVVSGPVVLGEAVKVVPAEQLREAVEAGNAMYALLDRPEDYDAAARASVMEAWLNATLDRERGRYAASSTSPRKEHS